jgi:cyclic beta-1,2-glucan synthetase
MRREGDFLRINPCVPRAWAQATVTLRHGAATYVIVIRNPDRVCSGVTALRVDGRAVALASGGISLFDDGTVHPVDVVLGATLNM